MSAVHVLELMSSDSYQVAATVNQHLILPGLFKGRQQLLFHILLLHYQGY